MLRESAPLYARTFSLAWSVTYSEKRNLSRHHAQNAVGADIVVVQPRTILGSPSTEGSARLTDGDEFAAHEWLGHAAKMWPLSLGEYPTRFGERALADGGEFYGSREPNRRRR